MTPLATIKKSIVAFFDLDDFVEIYNKIFEQLIRNRQYSRLSVPCFLESLLLPKQNEKKLLERQDMWIRQCIQQFCNDEAKMYCLFSVVSKLEIKRKKSIYCYFLRIIRYLKTLKKYH